ncbi:MAG: NmrA family NAD(P)-binding protein, partial [Nitrososphaeraceae archaeon]
DKAAKIKYVHEIVKIDYTRQETIANALRNIDRLFLRILPTIEMVDNSSQFVQEAKKNGVKFIVKLSAMGADLKPGYTSGRLHRQVEKIIKESEIPYVFLRPNSAMQNFITRTSQTIKNQRTINLPSGDAGISFVDARDIAAVSAEILTKNGSQYADNVFDITGSEALSHSQVAEILSKQTGKNITYMNTSEENTRNEMKKMGIKNWFIDNALELYNIYRSGYRSQITSVVEQLTKHKPTTFSQLVKNYAQNGLSWPNQLSTFTGWLRFE